MKACFGDSITAGKPGCSYLQYLDKKEYRNFGLGGDTLIGVTRRISDHIKKFPSEDLIIAIGANDLYLPFLERRSAAWKRVTARIRARGSVPAETREAFGKRYDRLLQIVAGKCAGAVSIPCIGEDLESDLNLKVEAYNQTIRSLCLEYRVTYLDFHTWQKAQIRKQGFQAPFFGSDRPIDTLLDIFMTNLLGVIDPLSRKRSLVTTIDGIHLNRVGAHGLAELIAGSGSPARSS